MRVDVSPSCSFRIKLARYILLLAICTGPVSQAALPQESEEAEQQLAQPQVPYANILLVLKLQKAPFSPGDPIEIRVVLTSHGTLPARVPEAFLDFSTIQTHQLGKPWLRCSPSSTTPAGAPIATRELPPGEVWETPVLRLDSLCDVKAAGEYEVSLYYSMPPTLRAEGDRHDPRYAGMWVGEMADAVRFTVKPSEKALDAPAHRTD